MSRARHVDRMPKNPGYVTGPLAGTVKDGKTTIHTLCMQCRTVVTQGPKKDGKSSHGLCDRCYRMFMAELAIRELSKYGTAVQKHDRQSEEVVRAFGRVTEAIYAIVDAPSENGPGASQGTRGLPSGDDTSKVADAPADGNSGRNRDPYVVTVGSPGGTVARYRYADFDAMLADVERVAEKHRGPMAFGNEDRADVDDSGLSDDEVERLEEVL